jgi:hypothetical protein
MDSEDSKFSKKPSVAISQYSGYVRDRPETSELRQKKLCKTSGKTSP